MTTKSQRRFAEGTTVPVGKTRDELESLLARHGAQHIQVTRDIASGRAIVLFDLNQRTIQLRVAACGALPDPSKTNRQQQIECPRGWGTWSIKRREDWVAARRDQSEREQWRRLLLVTRAKLELAFEADSSVEREFLADILLPSGATVHEALAPGLQQSYSDGSMPKLLLGPGGGS